MPGQSISRIMTRYRSKQRPRRRLLAKASIFAFAVAQICFILFGLDGQSAADRASIAASIFTADAIFLAAWQWREQRRAVSLEAYFSRLDLPNQRRLAYYEQVSALGDKIGKEAAAGALEQFYVFYMYAELDNLEYAMTKYTDGSMSVEMAERAVQTFVSRCAQSNDFRRMACVAVTGSGYAASFEALVNELAGHACEGGDPPAPERGAHPMRHDELDVVRELRGERK